MNSKLPRFESCPGEDVLARFVVGEIADGATRVAISGHLEECSECISTLARMERCDDPLVASLQRAISRGGSRNIISIDADCEHVLQRVLEIGSVSEIRFGERSTAKSVGGTRADVNGIASPGLSGLDSHFVGPYQLLEEIGVGGMGVVYKAVHTKMNRIVAVKLLPAGRSTSGQASRRFEREMQAVGRLSHPNIVVGYDAGEANSQCFLAMEMLEGFDLSTLSKVLGKPIGIADCCEMIRQAAVGLGYAHENGIIHRDVKPSNIMLCATDRSTDHEASGKPDGQSNERRPPVVKLLDLGLARFEQPDPTQESMTSINQIMGTIDYMSPEQCLDSREVDARSDIYSLGATLYCLLVGRAPWAIAGCETQGQKLKSLLSEKLASIKSVRPEIPEPLAAIVDRALSQAPDNRFQNIDEFLNAISPLATGHDLSALLDNARALQPAPVERATCPAFPEYSRSQFADSRSEFNKPQQNQDRLPPRNIAKWLGYAAFPIAFLLLGIIWLRTDGGYIRIESDPSIDVSVEVLRDGKKIGTVEIGKGENSYWYRSGQYEIRLAADAGDNLGLSGERFTLTRGQKPVVTITKVTDAQRADELAGDGRREPEKESVPATKMVSPVDRHAILRWVVNNNGDCSTDHGFINTEADIPQGPFEIHRIAIRDADNEKTRVVCDWLANLPECEQLYLSGGHNRLLTDEAIPLLNKGIYLTWLALESANITDEGVQKLEEMPRLRTLGLNDLLVTEKCLASVAEKLPNLTELGIFSLSLADDDLRPLRKMGKLRTFDLNTPKLSKRLFEPVMKTSVDRLTIRGVSKCDAEIGEMIAKMPDLIDLAIQNADFGDDQLDGLANARNLKFLRLGGTSISVAGLRRFIDAQPQIVVYLDDPKSPLRELSDLTQVKDVSGIRKH